MSNHTKVIDDGGNYLKKKKEKTRQDKKKRRISHFCSSVWWNFIDTTNVKYLHYFTFVNLLVQKLLQWKDRWLFISFLNSCEHGDKKQNINLVINLLLHEYKTSHLHFLCLRKSVIFIILSLNLNTWVHISITGQSLAHWLIRWAALIRGFVETYRWSWWPRLHSDWSSWRHLWTCLDLGLAEDRNTDKSSSSVYWCHFPHVPHSGRTAIQWRWASPFFTAATRVNEKQTARSTQTRKALTFYCNCRAATLFTPPVSLCSCTSTYCIADQSKFAELMGGRINKSNVWISTAAEHCMYHIHCKWSSNNVKQM